MPASPQLVSTSHICLPRCHPGTPQGSHVPSRHGEGALPTQGVAPVGAGMGHSHSCCLKGGWDCRTEIKMKKRKRGHRSSMASWIWGTPMVGAGGPCPHRHPGLCLPLRQDPAAPGALPPRLPAHPLPPAVGEVLPEQQPQLGAHGHGGDAGDTCPVPHSAPAAGESRRVSAELGVTVRALVSLWLTAYRTLGKALGTRLSSGGWQEPAWHSHSKAPCWSKALKSHSFLNQKQQNRAQALQSPSRSALH